MKAIFKCFTFHGEWFNLALDPREVTHRELIQIMNSSTFSKAVAAILLGLLFGWYVHHDYLRWCLRGREAFIAHETQRFNLYMENPHWLMVYIIQMAVFALGVCVVYESIEFAVSTAIKRTISSPR